MSAAASTGTSYRKVCQRSSVFPNVSRPPRQGCRERQHQRPLLFRKARDDGAGSCRRPAAEAGRDENDVGVLAESFDLLGVALRRARADFGLAAVPGAVAVQVVILADGDLGREELVDFEVVGLGESRIEH